MSAAPPDASRRIIVPPHVTEICGRLAGAGFRAWVVGGAVRDMLLNPDVVPDEWDIATSAHPADVMRVFPRTVPTGIAHGTVTVLAGEGRCEVTTLRREGGYADARHPDEVTFVGSIEEDLSRRDFTVNAIAFDPAAGRLVDPFDGREDLRCKVIRAVGSPLMRFVEDGLRPLRAARFTATLGFRMEQATFAAMEKALPSFMMVSAERKRDEIVKMMKAARPSLGWEVLRRARYLEAVFPRLHAMVGVHQGGLHRFDVWNHSIMACDFCEGDWRAKLAALLHDAGKPVCMSADVIADGAAAPAPPGEVEVQLHFYGHEKEGAAAARAWMESMRFSNADAERVERLVRCHMVLYDSSWSDAAVRRFLKRVGEDLVDDLFLLAEADVKARGVIGTSLASLKELQTRVKREQGRGAVLSLRDLAVTGLDVIGHLGIDPGPEVGRILKELLERTIEDPALNRRERLLGMAEEIRGR